MARMKKRVIRSGKMLEVNYYPVTASGKIIPNERPKTTKSKKEMDEANRRKAIKNFVRMINANFDSNDYFASLTYIPEFAPDTEERANKDFNNFIARIRYRIKKNGGNPKKLKFAVVPQCVTYKTGLRAGKNNYHFHLFLSGSDITSDEVKELWPFGTKGNVRSYDPYMFGPEAAAKYMAKSHTGKKMYRCSRNMKKPIIEEEKNALVNPRMVEELGRNRCDDARYWEKKYPSYQFCRMDKQFNDINGCWYIDVIMYKKPDNLNSYYQKSRKAYTTKC